MKPILLQPIHIKLKPTKMMLGLLVFISMVCCLILIVLPIPALLQFGTILLIMLSSGYFILRDALLLLPASWQALEVNAKGRLRLLNKRGQQLEPALANNTFIHAKVTVLNFKRNGFELALPPVILLSSAENENELRRLRVWLRWGKLDASSMV